MKRSALIASVSTLALVFVGPVPVQALPGDAASWWGRSSSEPAAEPSRKPAKARPRPADKTESGDRKSKNGSDKTAEKAPTGLLHVIISIDKQRATLFADGLPIASTAVSTGTAGHPTPTGLFTIIQKSRHHVSNLYNAPMPYMQRITWSGSALHEGPLPGYPASHGCVRLSTGFAQMLWKATKMSARVIITRPEVAPHEFAHPRLFVPTPKLAAAPRGTDAFAADTSDKSSVAKSAAAAPVIAAPVAAPQPAATAAASPARVKTADASNPAVAVVAMIGDASVPTTTGVVTEPTSGATAEQPTKLSVTDGVGGKPESAPETVAAPATVPAAEPAQAAETVPAADAKPAETETVASIPAAAPVEAPVADAKPVQVEITKAAPVQVEAKLAAPASIIADERPAAMPPAIVKEAKQRPISVFVSLKEGKLYVRQGWQPLFDAPVTFENPGQPIGTHLYTAMGAQADGSGLRWTVVSIPSDVRRFPEKTSEHGRKLKNERPVKAAEVVVPPMPSPSAALDRVVIPQDVLTRISEMITPGSSLIVSDNRLSDETGQYTDFIVTTR